MSTICFCNLKGGVGKSTTCVHFIYWLSQIKKKNVAVIDADGQSSTSNWLEVMQLKIPVYHITDPDELADQVPELEQDVNYLVIDNAGNLGDATRCTLLTASLAVIPVTPSGLDMMSAASAVRMVKQIQKARKGLPSAGIFINRAIKNTKLLKESQQLLTEIEGINIFKQVIYQKQMIADSFLQGSTVWQMKGVKDAAQDYDKLFREILRMDK
ncbi:AAA family ATPase [Mastigocoleus sp. MO_188.B34]|uniref:nucleotide-binding protein n=1 Tax=Mastigocoleus sp. MO_188.B34 TaxID=3036635 RepID=UPI002620A616|nr:AAA family ATPase [Mastigocoleus sp. MO_188.B34]MDJ0697533.1 AAA family ATPase [Mastigocoleus sp. MO_188.B34]